MPKTSRNKLQETYYPLVEEEARAWYQRKYVNTTAYILVIKRLFTKPEANFVIPNVVEFCKEWGITKSSFYRAVNTLASDGEINWEATQGIVLKPSEKVVPIPRTGQLPTNGTASHERDSDSHERDSDSHERDESIYIDRVRDRSNSDLNSDLVQISPPTPQGVDDDKPLREIPIPSQPKQSPSVQANLVSNIPARDNNTPRAGRVRGVTLATRDGIPEVRVSMRGTYEAQKPDFFGADKPWSELAVQAHATPKEVHALAQRWIAGRCADKKDPKMYASGILNKLAQDPNSKYNTVLWLEFEDAVLEQGIDELIAALEAEEANRLPEPGQGFYSHPRKNEWLETIKRQNLGFADFVLAGKEDGTLKVREKFYAWIQEQNLFTFSWS